MRPSKLIAVLAFLGLVPASLAVAYAGSPTFYGHSAIPVVFAVVFAVGLVGTFLIIPVLREWVD